MRSFAHLGRAALALACLACSDGVGPHGHAVAAYTSISLGWPADSFDVAGFNNAAQLVGTSYLVGGQARVFVLSSTSPPRILDVPAGTVRAAAVGINDSGGRSTVSSSRAPGASSAA